MPSDVILSPYSLYKYKYSYAAEVCSVSSSMIFQVGLQIVCRDLGGPRIKLGHD